MARPLRIEFPGAFHHVMARGNARQSIFRSDGDREAFLAGLKRVCERFDWRVWAYCLMDNHYHLLVETLEPTLARGMREINGLYTQAFNRRYSEHRTQNTEHRTQNTEHRTQNTEHRTQNKRGQVLT